MGHGSICEPTSKQKLSSGVIAVLRDFDNRFNELSCVAMIFDTAMIREQVGP